jgi:hypothetical protein
MPADKGDRSELEDFDLPAAHANHKVVYISQRGGLNENR